MDPELQQKFQLSRHVGYLLANLQQLPEPYAGQESNRLTLAYFAVVGLEVLGALDEGAFPEIVEWVYSLQVTPGAGAETGERADICYGFRGSPSVGIAYSAGGVPSQHQYDTANIAATYSGLAILHSVGDDFSRVARGPILRTLARLQQPDGSFGSVCAEAESDMRFVFCAAAICYLLGDCSAIDVEAAVRFIERSRGYSGGFGLAPGLEAHGGATYCAVAALKLLSRLKRSGAPEPRAVVGGSLGADVSKRPGADVSNACGADGNKVARGEDEGAEPDVSNATGADVGEMHLADVSKVGGADVLGGTLEWCLQRQTSEGGLQGRVNKDADTCYAFWIGASLEMLGGYSHLDAVRLRSFLLSCQNQKYGGFSKHPGELPDLLHTFYGICGLSLLGQDGLKRLDVSLGCPAR